VARKINLPIVLSYLAAVPLTARIGYSQPFTLFGYTSSNSYVQLQAPSTSAQTISDSTGYFEFSQIILPTQAKELCFTSKDSANRSNPPICIVTPNFSKNYQKVGPILLAPTLSLSNSNPKPGETLIASGQTIPNRPLTINLYAQNPTAPSFPKSAMAASNTQILQIPVQADTQGNFSLNLPTTKATAYKVIAQTIFETNNLSPPSFPLYFSLPTLLIFLLQILPIFVLFLPLLCLFFFLLFIQHQTKPHFYPALYPKQLIPYSNLCPKS
jgi:hypothetical protein